MVLEARKMGLEGVEVSRRHHGERKQVKMERKRAKKEQDKRERVQKERAKRERGKKERAETSKSMDKTANTQQWMNETASVLSSWDTRKRRAPRLSGNARR
jgi:hypothetical protein